MHVYKVIVIQLTLSLLYSVGNAEIAKYAFEWRSTNCYTLPLLWRDISGVRAPILLLITSLLIRNGYWDFFPIIWTLQGIIYGREKNCFLREGMYPIKNISFSKIHSLRAVVKEANIRVYILVYSHKPLLKSNEGEGVQVLYDWPYREIFDISRFVQNF